MPDSGYLDSPWPAEDGGPRRLQHARRGAGLRLQPGERLACTTRNTLLSTMTVLGAPGEVYLLTHSALRAHVGLPTTACVERIDPQSLKPLARSPRLRGGPMWPGGMALHRNGDLFAVYGRWLHRLDRQCAVRGALRLPVAQPYNSFVILDNGLIVTKNLSDATPARLSTIDPESMANACADVVCPEPSVARLSAQGNSVLVVGVRSVMRYHWNDATQALEADALWRHDYLSGTAQSYGWDAVLARGSAWFMDNGRHRYRFRMAGAGVARTPNRLLRVSLQDARDHGAWEVSGLPGGSITNPPLVDERRGIVLGFDSANSVLQAWQMNDAGRKLAPLWTKPSFGCASHMLLYPDSGEVVTNDYRRFGEEVVVLDIASGAEKARVRVGGPTQGVVFPSTGWGRDLYWSSMGRLARVHVA